MEGGASARERAPGVTVGMEVVVRDPAWLLWLKWDTAVGRVTPLSPRTEAPELSGQTDRGEHSFGLLGRPSLPVRIRSVGVPDTRQVPLLLHGEAHAPGQVSLPSPPFNVFFRPEEKHVRSVEPNVVPPLPGGNGVMDDVGRRQHVAASDLDA